MVVFFVCLCLLSLPNLAINVWHTSMSPKPIAPVMINWQPDHKGIIFYEHGWTLVSALISNYIHYRMWDEISYPLHHTV